MSLDLANYDQNVKEAVKAFWGNRHAAAQKQKELGSIDVGERAGVTSGKNMDGFVALVVEIIKANGLSDADIHLAGRLLTLPGYFRPTKLWDLLVIRNGRLVAALEFKSQVGPSFGNNFNNRTEEAIGMTHDLWTAYREGAFGDQPKPFVGWMMLLEDAPESRSIVNDRSPHFPIFADFKNASYADRYNVLCKKLVQEQLCSATALVLSKRTGVEDGAYIELAETTGVRNFVAALAGHIAAEAVR